MKRLRWPEVARLLMLPRIAPREGGLLILWRVDGSAIVLSDETGSGRMRADYYSAEEANKHLAEDDS